LTNLIIFAFFILLILGIFVFLHGLIKSAAYTLDERYLHNRFIVVTALAAVAGGNTFTYSWQLLLVSKIINHPSINAVWETILPERAYEMMFLFLLIIGTNMIMMLAILILQLIVKAVFSRFSEFIDLEDLTLLERVIHFPWVISGIFYGRDENGDPELKEVGVTCGLWAGSLKNAFFVLGLIEILLTSMFIIFAPRAWFEVGMLVLRGLYFLPCVGYLLIEQFQYMLQSDIEAEAGTFSSENIQEIQYGNVGVLTAIYNQIFGPSGAIIYSDNCNDAVTYREGMCSNDLGNRQIEDCRLPEVLAMISMQIRESGVVQNDKYQNAIVSLLNGNSVNIRDHQEGEFLIYLSTYLNYHISQGRTALILCNTPEDAERMRDAVVETMRNLNNLYSIWKVRTIQEADTDLDINILVCSYDDFLSYSIVDKRQDYVNDLFCVCIMDGFFLFGGDPVRTARLFSELERVSDSLQYVMLTDIDNDDLRTTCENYINHEMIPYRNDRILPETYVMVWKQESSCRLQNWIGIGSNHSTYLGTAFPIALVGAKYDMPLINIVDASGEGIHTFGDTSMMSRMEVDKYLERNLNLRSIIRTDSREALQSSYISEIIAFDTDNNLLNVLWKWSKYGGKLGTLIHIISHPYMLRDYMADRFGELMIRGGIFDPFVSHSMSLRVSRMAALLIELCDNGITEEHLMKRSSEYEWGYVNAIDLLRDCITSVLTNPEVHNVYESFLFTEEKEFSTEEGGFVKSTRITLTDENIRRRLLEKIAFATIVEKGEQESTIHIFKDNIYNYFLPEQIISVKGYLNRIRSIRDGRIIVDEVMPQDLPDYYTISDFSIKLRKRIDACEDSKAIDWDLFNAGVERRIYGYWESNDGNAFVGRGTGRIRLCGGDRRYLSVKNDNASVLRVKVHNNAIQGDPDKTCRLMVYMLNEIFKTVFPNSWQNIIAVMGRGEEGFWDELLKPGRKISSDQALRSIIPFTDDTEDSGEYTVVYIVEISSIEMGLCRTLYDKRARVMGIITDYLDWYLQGQDSSAGNEESREKCPENASGNDASENSKSRNEASENASSDRNSEGESGSSGQEESSAGNEDQQETAQNRGSRSSLHFGCAEVPQLLDLESVRSLFRNELHHVVKKPSDQTGRIVVDEKNRCTFCGKASLFMTLLSDGRKMCNHCKDHQIKQRDEIKVLFRETIKFMEEGYQIRIRKNIHVRFQSAETIRRAVNSGPGGRVLGFYNNQNHQLWIEARGPRVSVQDTLIHELTHTWQHDNLPISRLQSKLTPVQMLILLEGHAVYTEIETMRRLNEVEYASSVYEETLKRKDEYGIGYIYLRDFLKQCESEGSYMNPFSAMQRLCDEILAGRVTPPPGG